MEHVNYQVKILHSYDKYRQKNDIYLFFQFQMSSY